MTLTNLTGTVKFKVDGQSALPRWMQTALRDALDNAAAPPESLRFQCRIATDAKRNFEKIDLANGETLSLHPRSNPQFGKNRDGHAYLTASFTYSGDGMAYTIRWVGDAVPQKMQEVAVKHDKGLSVKPTVVALDLAQASITPSWKANGHAAPGLTNVSRTREKAAEDGRRQRAKATRGKRNCARLTDADLAA